MTMAFPDEAVAAVANFRQGSMSSRVHDLLREAIIQLRLRPGNLLSETELARQFGVSRQPVREAFIKLAEAGLVEIRPQREKLRAPAQAGGADPGALGDLGQRPPRSDPGVGGIETRGDAEDREAFGKLSGNILGAVHGEVDAPVEQGALDLADEPRLVVARSRDGDAAALVAGGADGDELGGDGEGVEDVLCLGEREGAAPGPDAQLLGLAGAVGVQSRRPSARRSGVTCASAPSGSVAESRPKRSRSTETWR